LANGSSGTIRVPKEYRNVPVVPESATYEQQGVVYVYKVQDDTLAISTPVELVERVKNIAIIRSGIKKVM
jgi:membrane fusion protein, multidrug efflux system